MTETKLAIIHTIIFTQYFDTEINLMYTLGSVIRLIGVLVLSLCQNSLVLAGSLETSRLPIAISVKSALQNIIRNIQKR